MSWSSMQATEAYGCPDQLLFGGVPADRPVTSMPMRAERSGVTGNGLSGGIRLFRATYYLKLRVPRPVNRSFCIVKIKVEALPQYEH
jgi:hypothetical protein